MGEIVQRNTEKRNRLEMTGRDKLCSKIIEWGILGLIILSPLPKASVHEWSILTIQLVVLVMMGAYVLMRVHPKNNELLKEYIKWPRYLFIGLFILIACQIFPWPKFFVKILSPKTYSFWKEFVTNFSSQPFVSISVIPAQTLRQGLELLTYFLLGFLVIKTVTTRRQIWRIFSVIAAMGVFEAFYGLFELYNKNPHVLFYKKIYGLDSVTGTFVNRNHFSGYLEMALPITIGLIIARINLFSLGGLKWRKKLLRLSEKGLAVNLLLTFGVVAMALAVIFSKSRSGVSILILTFLLFFELSVLYFRRAMPERREVKRFLQVTFVIITLIALYVGIEATIERFALDKILNEGRPTVWANTLGMVSDFPLFGCGLGTFASLYPSYESSWLMSRYSHTHNDYLEYLAELGTIGMLLLLGGILFLLGGAFFIWKERRHPEVKGLALGGMIAVFNILVHSIGDFNLHIPANMVLFSIVLPLTVVTAYYKSKE